MVLVDASSVSPSNAIVWASLIVPCLQGCSWPWQAVAGMHVALRVGQELQRLKIFCSLDFARLTGATPQSLTTALLFVSDQEVSMSPNFESYAQCLRTFWIPPRQFAPQTPSTSTDARRRPTSRSCLPYGKKRRIKPGSTAQSQTHWAAIGTGIKPGSMAR